MSVKWPCSCYLCLEVTPASEAAKEINRVALNYNFNRLIR